MLAGKLESQALLPASDTTIYVLKDPKVRAGHVAVIVTHSIRTTSQALQRVYCRSQNQTVALTCHSDWTMLNVPVLYCSVLAE